MTESSRQLDRFKAVGRTCAISLVAVFLIAGCGRGPETNYGGSRGASLNGTGTFASLLRNRGHQVRSAWRLNEELAAWADVILRFAATPGPPDRDEADWYHDWLESGHARSLVYVVRDYDAEAEYWNLVMEQLGGPADAERREEARTKRDRAKGWVSRLPGQARPAADSRSWFAIAPATEPPAVCKDLDGPLASGLDASRAAITVHAPLKLETQEPLLTGDGKVLAMQWEVGIDSRVLAIANGSFLLNLPLVNPERRRLAGRVADWLWRPRARIAFVEGYDPLGDSERTPTLFDLIARIDGFRWAAIHFGVFGLLACLARAPRLGRPRPEPRTDADRPAAHAEALGALLERSRSPETARELLGHYRRWRFPQHLQRAEPRARS